jgi:histidinol-phosphatase (PHP family)
MNNANNKFLIESHSHTFFSHDGQMDIKALVEEAKKRGYYYVAVTEHLDRDYLCVRDDNIKMRQLDLKAYKKGFDEAKKLQGDKLYLAFGVEVGFGSQKQVKEFYENKLPMYDFDVIINSVHVVQGKDLYYPYAYEKFDKATMYNKYINAITNSLRANYPYDIVGHIGYISRYAPYDDKGLLMPETKDAIDEMLLEIVKRDKTIEINTNNKAGNILPERCILERYFLLGGRNVTFSSDAHYLNRLGDRYEQAASLALSCGFTHWTIYKKRQKEYVPIVM